MRLVITGATGYIGTALIKLASNRGYEVIIASRKRPSSLALPWLYFDLSSKQSFVLPSKTNVVIHLAANTTQSNELSEEMEILAAQRLIKSAQDLRAGFIFISSQTARADAITAYGRIKYRIEQEVLSHGGSIVRPGQVYGGELCGLFGLLVKLVHRWRILPIFLPNPRIQPIHIEDLAEGLIRIIETYDHSLPSGIYNLAAPQSISFSKFLAAITQSRIRSQRLWVPVPVVLINVIMIIIGKVRSSCFGLDRLQSLLNLQLMQTQTTLNQLDLQLRPLSSGMHPSGSDRRRNLMREGRALLMFVLKTSPSSTLLRRYIRVIEHLRDGLPLGLKSAVLSYPCFLSLLQPSDCFDIKLGEEFAWRLDAVTVLAEATSTGANRFLGLCKESGMFRSLLILSKACICEIFCRMLRVPFRLLIQPNPKRKKVVL